MVTLHTIYENLKPFIWAAKANDILQKVIRANSRLSSKQNEALHWFGDGGERQRDPQGPKIGNFSLSALRHCRKHDNSIHFDKINVTI